MDHSTAVIMELSDDVILQHVVDSEFTHQEKEFSLSRSEKGMHTKEKHLQENFYKKLGNTIQDYDEVILFGPTNAKNELLNLLKSDIAFKSIKINVKDTDKMTENQRHAFVREYYK